jgi:prepilin-type N-terminal cleavage/methylation domain-containing protein
MIANSTYRIPLPARQAGFTVIELMIAVVLVAILTLFALPSFRETAVRNNVSVLNNSLIHTMNVARAEAVRRGVAVSVNSTGGSTWSGGWSVVDASGNTLSQQGPVPAGGYSVCGKASGGGTDGTIVFTSLGALGGGANQFDVNVNRPDGNQPLSQRVTIGVSGQVQARPNTTGSPASTSTPC